MSTNEITVCEQITADAATLLKVNEFLKQLTDNVQISMNELENIISSSNTHLFFIRYNNEVAGMLSVGDYHTPTGRKFWIEDVVVDESFRGKSLGKKLITYAIDYVAGLGRSTLMLTSNPKRVAANNLYQSVGFERKETNVYKMTFPLSSH